MRAWGSLAIVFLLLALLGGFTWCTQHPDAALLERAERWPVVGSLAARFRRAYLAPPPAPVAPGGFELVIVGSDVTGPGELSGEAEAGVEEARARRPRPSALSFVWVRAGDLLHAAANEESELLHRFAEPARLTRLDRRGDWYLVRGGGPMGEGWVRLPGYSEISDPPFGSAPAVLGPLFADPPDLELLASARRLLETEVVGTLGPYALYTEAGALSAADLDWLSRLAAGLDSTYTTAFGVAPIGEPREAVVLYRDEADYRGLQRQLGQISGLAAGGHAFRGLAVSWIGERPREIVAAVLVHELTHLLNRRAIGPALPPWLDEGLAERLATSHVAADGRLVLDRLGGVRRSKGGGEFQLSGGLASAELLREAFARAETPALGDLLAADWEGFVLSDRRELHYAYVGLWMRYLQRPGGAESAALFGFLKSTSEGGSAAGSELLRTLGTNSASIDKSFRKWILRRFH